MSEMVDRVAASIHSVQGIMIPFEAMDDASAYKIALRLKAIAAIQAMREPSANMIDVGGEIDNSNLLAFKIWTSMIDEALK